MTRVVVVRHDTDLPALFGAAAALVAARIGGRVFWPEARFDLWRHPDAVQHVSRDGVLTPSGLIWAERLNAAGPRPLAELGGDVAVVSLHPALVADAAAVEGLVAMGAEDRTIRLDGARFVDETGETIGWRDVYGRVLPAEPARSRPSAPVIAMAGPARQFLDTCPAPLAALADALEREAPGGAVRFIGPRDFAPASLDGVDGLLLPGGSEMSVVEGQIAMAGIAREAGLPVVGLCLGMQSMATAIARTLPGWEGACLAEAAPDGVRHSFVRIETGEHRLGWHETSPVVESHLARLLRVDTAIACNHRYRLVPALHAKLASRGIRVSALGGALAQGIADGIEADEGFFIGMQGHPELSSRQGKPHPLLCAFVLEAREHAGR